MKEPATITCPHCGKETSSVDICRHCGKEIEFGQNMEVLYRDFKGSEMLDIKMAPSARQEHETPDRQKTESVNNASRPGNKRAGKKTVFFFWAAVVIILSAIAWYYLLRLFLTS